MAPEMPTGSTDLRKLGEMAQLMARQGSLQQLRDAFDRKAAEGRVDEAKLILRIIKKSAPADDFATTAAEKLKKPRKPKKHQQPALRPGFIAIDEYCRSRSELGWKDRQWLKDVSSAFWTDAQNNARYTVPDGRTRFRFPDEWRRRTGVLSLRFHTDDIGSVTVRFDLEGRRHTLLPLNRDRTPDLGRSPLQGVLTAIAMAIYRDCRVVGQIAHGGGAVRTSVGSSVRPRSSPAVFARTVYSGPGNYFGASRYSPYAAHSVSGHARRLAPGSRASSSQIALAVLNEVIIGPGETFVRPHTRGGAMSGLRSAVSRMAGQLFDKLHFAVSW